MNTPDVTPIQLVALAGALLDVAVQFGVKLTEAQTSSLENLFFLLAALVLADAGIRHGRANVLTKEKELEYLSNQQ